ncbi:MAG: cyclic nucleotide-binding domain-containing protein [Proteobacteria bacterium]|nr:cyclic nucleotide-binding domain-containing protein [Pseudomonadota bacterium]
MSAAALIRQGSAGVITGLSAIIYSLSYGALLFAGPLSSLVAYAITITLITAVIGAVVGVLSEGRSFIVGPDSNTITVLASILAVLGSMQLPGGPSGPLALQLALAAVALTGVFLALTFFFVARANLAQLVRYIPFAVMAGFLAATGWLIASGALNIIAGIPLSFAGLSRFLANPWRPELAFGIAIALILFVLAPRVASSVLIPAVMVGATAIVNFALQSDFCPPEYCAAHTWLFQNMAALPWTPPWELTLDLSDTGFLFDNLAQMLIVAFVGLVTTLLSIASLELSYQREFDLNKILKQQAAAAGLSAMVGGFSPILSIGRSLLNHRAGGDRLGGLIAGALCLATLLGAGNMISYVPKPALGGLVLFLGIGMLRQWLWDPCRSASRLEIAQIVSILLLVANFGFMVGFLAGVLLSCAVFIVTYSRLPIASVSTNLALFTSSVARSEAGTNLLRKHGEKTLLYRLRGYVFFGSASKIDKVFRAMAPDIEAIVIDFSSVSGIDSSAVGVFQRMLRRHQDKGTTFYLVYSEPTERAVRAITLTSAAQRIHYFDALDRAIETAEDHLIARRGGTPGRATALQFLADASARATFLGYCEQRRITRGEALCADGDMSNEVYFLESGGLEVVKVTTDKRVLRLAKLDAGSVVGELAFYTGEARTAAIVADVDSTVYVLRREDLKRLRESHPDLAAMFDHMVIHKVSHALTRANKLLALYR